MPSSGWWGRWRLGTVAQQSLAAHQISFEPPVGAIRGLRPERLPTLAWSRSLNVYGS